MRLIDADAFIDRCKEFIAEEWNQNHSPSSWACAYEDVIDNIEEQPTIDAISRKELLNILNVRLEFLKRWRDGMPNFKKCTEIKIEDCEEIIDIICKANMK